MSLSAEELRCVIDVLNRNLINAIVRKVISPATPNRIAFELRTPGQNHYLQIVAMSGATRLGRVSKKPRPDEYPHPFVMLLKRELGGTILAGISQINRDRAVRLEFAGRERHRSLVCELTSRHTNLFLLDASDLITGSFFPNRSNKRRLVPGEPYIPPLPRPHASHAKADTGSRFSLGPDLENQIEKHYVEWENRQSVEQETARTKRLANSVARHLDRLEKKVEADRSRAAEGERLADFGHLLKANLRLATRGAKNLEVKDFEGNKAVIPMDPRLGPVENMERLFARSKRLRRALPKIDVRQAKIRADRAWIEEILAEIQNGDAERLEAIREEIATRFPKYGHRSVRHAGAQAVRLPYREFTIATGRPARVGRSSKDNDTLTLRFARPDDLWLHVRGQTGSHVVVPLGRGENPTADLLVDAAHLAVHFSSARDETDVEVVHTRRRYVQKPRGAPPGSVRLLKEKTIKLRVEQERLKRLLNRLMESG
ncbi:MAG: DUF814 domain-containing protein [Proteobacteria bacterium]|nr:DUF814 domain-containing protein [Pseudomonadota bacterium]